MGEERLNKLFSVTGLLQIDQLPTRLTIRPSFLFPPLTRHVQTQLALEVFAHLHPAVLAQGHLLKVDDVVSGRTIAIVVELEAIATEPWNEEFNSINGRERTEECIWYGIRKA